MTGRPRTPSFLLARDIYRRACVRLAKLVPLRHPRPFDQPTIVVGSAPKHAVPTGMNRDWPIISVNGSQSNSDVWGFAPPTVTLIPCQILFSDRDNARWVRTVLNERHTQRLILIRPKVSRAALRARLQEINYTFDMLETVNRSRRMAMFETVLKRPYSEDKESKASNGLVAVAYALASKAPAVIIAGINPASKGHAYNNLQLERKHTSSDALILRELLDLGHPIFTADPDVSEATGIPLWTDTKSPS